jgi:uncharacterized protein YqjF (DUF2071 family)
VARHAIQLQQRTLEEQGHRPWPLPDGAWVQGQTWCDLLFAHWRVPAARLRRVVPPSLPLHLDDDGSAWLGITPFVVSGLRLRGTPPLPWVSRFPELNVRTYVELDGKPGIYFLSLDAARRAAVVAARRTYRLPYFHARMQVDRAGARIDYRSERTDDSGPPASFSGSYRPAGARADDSLGRWLAERYCAYTVDAEARPLRIDIHHPPWPLQPAEAELDAAGMASPLAIDLDGEPLLHFSARQDTLIWRPRRV